jgi:hypothetical protein
MKNYVLIMGDTDDEDIISSFTEIPESMVESFRAIANAIKNCEHRHNYTCLDRVSERYPAADVLYGHLEDFDSFDSCVPSHLYGIHTIYTIAFFNGGCTEIVFGRIYSLQQ